jgi:hypothetical protein
MFISIQRDYLTTMFTKKTSFVWLGSLGFIVVILIFSTISVNTSNTTTNEIEGTKNDVDHQFSEYSLQK